MNNFSLLSICPYFHTVCVVWFEDTRSHHHLCFVQHQDVLGPSCEHADSSVKVVLNLYGDSFSKLVFLVAFFIPTFIYALFPCVFCSSSSCVRS